MPTLDNAQTSPPFDWTVVVASGSASHTDTATVALLAAVAHDLKSPLTVVRGSVGILRRELRDLEPGDLGPLDECLGEIEAAARQMERLINEIVQYAHLGSGLPQAIDRHPVDMVQLADQVVRGIRALHRSHQIRLDLPETSVFGTWDGARLRSVLENLICNALKYAPAGTAIDVRVVRETGMDGDWAVVDVSDEGRGIPADDLPSVFEPFWRGSNVGQVDGSGLGLSNVKHAVEAHGGKILLERRYGAGTTVSVHLPIS